ncbi:MAG: dihydrodipicolinate synthase family protein, partial [Jatrophihabitantaceae bacterium]
MNYARADAKQAARDTFQGVWAAITTPFAASGEVDEAALSRDLAHLTGPLGIDGIFCGGVMSEFWALSRAEREHAIEYVVNACRGRCPVIAHTGHHAARD